MAIAFGTVSMAHTGDMRGLMASVAQVAQPQYDADGIECIQELYDGSIWGPISFIDKYIDIDGNSINLFIYGTKYEAILPLFTELNNRMNFLYSDEVHDKDKRIERFIELTNKLGISTFKEIK